MQIQIWNKIHIWAEGRINHSYIRETTQGTNATLLQRLSVAGDTLGLWMHELSRVR